MGNFLVGVGGTGQAVALSYLRLCRLCGLKPEKIFIMDCDLSGPLADELGSFLGTTIEPIRPIPTHLTPDRLKTLETLFSTPEVKQNVDPILQALFTSEQLEIPISKGMFGRPSVGASALKAKIHFVESDRSGACAGDTTLAHLIELVKSEGDHRIAICGSGLGGTGAGGVPTLAHYLSENVSDKRRVKIYCFYFLRWFTLKNPGKSIDLLISDDMLRDNSEAGVVYMQEEVSKGINGCIFLGLPDVSKATREYEEVGEQSEHKHFLNLLCAILVNNSFYQHDFCPDSRDRLFGYLPPKKQEHLTPSQIHIVLPKKEDGETSTVPLNTVIQMAHGTSFFLRHFETYVNPPPGFSFFPNTLIPPNLRSAIHTLSQMVSVDSKTAWEKGRQEIVSRRRDLERQIEWFKDLKHPDIFWFEDKEMDIDLQRYGQRPFPFIKEWIETIDAKEWENHIQERQQKGFAIPVLTSLRRSINSRFLNQAFGDMTFLQGAEG